ncbi:MAG: hypothetical protein QOH42_2045 [Blastocatellia bacterium]|nr:hypothetical protein [Blastocatellia bacterium]
MRVRSLAEVFLQSGVSIEDKTESEGCSRTGPHPNPLPKGEGVKQHLNPCWLVHSGINPTRTHFLGTKKTMGRVYC